MKAIICQLVALLALTGSASATITILGEDGQAFNLDTTSGVATFAAQLQNPGGSAEPQYSPNGLGVSGGSYFYTTYNTPGADGFYRDNTQILSVAVTEPWNIAGGDAVGSNFYFVDRHNGKFVTISAIFGSPSANTPGVQIAGYGGDTIGDLAINGTTAYFSTDNILATFDITNPGGGFSLSVASSRYVGLGFDGGNLYGVLRVGANNFDLYSINTTSLLGTKVADITGASGTGYILGQYEITDAAAVVPEPTSLALLVLGGLLVARKRK